MMGKNSGRARSVRTLLQSVVAMALLAVVGWLTNVWGDTTWHPEWLLPFAAPGAALLSALQNTLEDRKTGEISA